MARSTRRRRRSSGSISSFTRRLFRGLVKIGLSTGLIGAVGALKAAIGTVNIDVLGTTVDLTIIPVAIAAGFGIFLMISAIRDIGVRI